ncbi:MAG: hypothetical protein U0L92_08650 [Clostridia bacterium]|nr:hypothetical protein [Clostridia bacterium]
MDMIQAIVSIEEKIRDIAASTDVLKLEYAETIQQEIQIREKETETEIAVRLEQLKHKMLAEQQEELELLEKNYEEKMQNLLHTFQINKQDWIKNLVQQVVQF